MLRAAAGLILNNNRALSFRRYNEQGLSLPCGKVEPDETPVQAAHREVKEETGLEVKLDESDPFIGFDIDGKSLVYTYIGTVKSGSLLDAEATGEGVPMWASLRELVYGPFGHYNNRALCHFNLEVPLAGKFHSHLTIQAPTSQKEMERAAQLVNGKLTIIDLSRDSKTQTDIMITHHYMTGYRGLEDEHDVLSLLKARARILHEAGFNVLRVKLEHEPLDAKSNIDDILNSLSRIYTEIHVKCTLPDSNSGALVKRTSELGWHPSRNPFSVREDGKLVRFINKRFYQGAALWEIDKEVDRLTPHILVLAEIEEIKYETTVYDSNENLDKWWME